MDIDMPILNGYEATQQIRRQYCEITQQRVSFFIALTAFKVTGELKESKLFDIALEKPLFYDKMEEVLLNLII